MSSGRHVAAMQPCDASVTVQPLPDREAAIGKQSTVSVDSAVFKFALSEGR